jgi:hypothetical protein
VLVNLELGESSPVNHEQCILIVKELGFLNESVLMNPLMEELWSMLSRGQEQVTVYQIKVASAAIMNFNYPWMKKQTEGEEVRSRVDPTNIGTFEDGNLVVTDAEIAWMSKHYLLMQ